ncbi:LysR family transcriptional regulator [Bacillus horti]|uniref:LysR family transcriptional repressor of citA n=1 Tax=Caldalkalibacillus horti TaxID=77523 RepID=A0ABT9W2G2_9BACI|nr:LysR family transcriptional regulator [Bacillus horti]MDQ0167440.1 LysR family transcriptional repressor of citA [Bacillus horti]
MDLKWIRSFVTAAKYQNFRQAAEQLYLAQPTISVHIQHLEEAIGSPLFERTGRNVILTPTGKRFLPYAEQLLATYESGIQDIEGYRQGYHRKLSLAVSPLIAASVLPSILRRFVEQYPTIEVQVHVRESKDIADDVFNGAVDLGLSRMQAKGAQLQSILLYEDPVILVAGYDGGELEGTPPLDADQLLSASLMLTYHHPEYWDGLLLQIKKTYPRLRTMIVSQVHIAKRFIEEGLGISFLPRSTVKRELLEGRLLEVDFKLFAPPVAATYWIQKYETEEIATFKSFLAYYYPSIL